MADWKNPLASTPGWIGEISNREAKAAVARQLAQRLQPGDVVGVGSGSTAFLALEACAARATNEGFSFTAIPTSLETAQSCVANTPRPPEAPHTSTFCPAPSTCGLWPNSMR